MRETHRSRYRLILLQPIITISSNIHEFLVQIFYNSQKNVTGVQDDDIGLYEAVKTAGKHFRAGSEMTWSQRFRRLHTAWFAVSQLQHPATHVCGLEFRHLSVVFPLSIDSTVIKPRMVFKQSGQLNEGVLQLLDSFREPLLLVARFTTVQDARITSTDCSLSNAVVSTIVFLKLHSQILPVSMHLYCRNLAHLVSSHHCLFVSFFVLMHMSQKGLSKL